MKTEPQVSAVIIFLNEERFLHEAVESVLAQTYGNWELLLVDDGSTDGSTAMARRYAEQYPARVRYLEHDDHQNRGMSASRNLAMRHATGEYIGILDADDVWFPHTLQQQVGILESHPEAALVYGRVQRWYSWTGTAADTQRDSMRDLGVAPDRLVRPPTQFLLLLQDKGMPSGIMVRHEVVERVGGFEETFRGMYEDNAFLAKVCLRETVFASGECWYKYRKHADSASSVAVRTGRYGAARRAFLNWAEGYLAEEEVKDPEIWRVLRRELRPYRHPRLYHLIERTRRLVRRVRGLWKGGDQGDHLHPSAASPATASQRRKQSLS
jgi:glycosyltransferase involved in cell wall biosynthesis